MVERLYLQLIEAESVLWVGHGGIDGVADDLQGALQRRAQRIPQGNAAMTAVKRGIMLRIGYPCAAADRAENTTVEPQSHGRQTFEWAFLALPIGDGRHLHYLLAEEKAEQIDAVDPHRHHGPGAAYHLGMPPPRAAMP